MPAQVTGKLMWGQAGSYDAIDDRQALSAALGGAPGVWITPTITAGTGLDVIVGRFTAAVGVEDGTLAVAGSYDNVTLAAQAGPNTGTREDMVWVDADPDGGTWGLDLVPRDELTGRIGIAIGGIMVPAGANLASQFTMWPAINNFGNMRTFLTSDQRQLFMDQGGFHPYWGGGWGNLSTLTNDERNNSVNSYHVDVSNPRYYRWETLYSEGAPGIVQSGRFTVTTTGSGQLTVTYPIPFSEPTTALVLQPSIWSPPVLRMQNDTATNALVTASNFDGTPAGNQTIYINWMARGVIITDTWPTAGGT